ncbi:hypothetical protein SAMN02746041_01960 [Desulfacinum hydrothermale DSM 13146]|uniref:Dicarboxylate transport n=1 Tax=Desulfacinum hydrothermale DSM 13146 TaxID=1121390 RepID=A0A1W1XK36_9BACT|nr:hypothetical protein [Desulfacinum hydrothermale]SMC24192.1 hypothetical protein SAMN02746041_01960 [Desulfacinum hydrothermale DSM 13146]
MGYGLCRLWKRLILGCLLGAGLLCGVLSHAAPALGPVPTGGEPALGIAFRTARALGADHPVPSHLGIRIHVEKAFYKVGPLSLKGLQAVLGLERKGGVLRFSLQEAKVDEVAWTGGQRPLRLRHVELNVRGRIEPDGGIQIQEAEVRLPRAGTLWMTGEMAPEGPARLVLGSQRLRLESVLAGFPAPAAGWGLELPAELRATWVRDGTGRWRSNGRIRFRKASFHDAKFLHAGEALGAQVLWSLKGREGGLVQGRLEAQASAGEVLWDRFYVNLSSHPLSIELKGTVNARGKRWHVQQAQVELQEVASVHLAQSSGAWSPFSGRLHLKIPNQDLGPFLELFVREPFQAELPWLSEASWAGRLGADLKLWVGKGLERAIGRIRLQEGRLRGPGKRVDLSGVHVNLPVWYEQGGPSHRRGRTDAGGLVASPVGPAAQVHGLAPGLLSWRAFRISGFELGPARLAIKALRNGISLPEVTVLRFANGQAVRLGPVLVENVWSPRRTGRVKLEADPWDVSPFLPPSLRADMRPVVHLKDQEFILQGERIRAKNPFTVDLFSGTIRVDRLELHHLLSPNREWRLDASWTDVDLEALTRATAFGRISGKLRGSVTGFRFAYGAPISFDLILESQDDTPDKREISVTAIDNLAQVGTSRSPFVGMASLLKVFFKDFPYKKIGIRCRLENDYFTVRGLVNEGGREYLVRRGLLRGVNVINQNPHNRISWNDMMARLSRIGKSGKARVQ